MTAEIKRSIYEKVKSHDMFGHTVQLNFNREGDSHKTVVGGGFSLFIKAAMLIYVLLNVKKLVLSEGDELSSEEFLVTEEGQQEVPVRDTKFILSPNIQKVMNGHKPIDYEDSKRFIEIRFAQKMLNYTPNAVEKEKEILIPARPCTAEDFDRTPATKKIFEGNKDKEMATFCPDLDTYFKAQKSKVSLLGTRSSLVQRRFEFQITRCDVNSDLRELTDVQCAQSWEIDEYIKDIEVELWTTNQQIDFQVYDGEPTFAIETFHGAILLEPDYVLTEYMSLQKNEVETEDALVQLGQTKSYTFYRTSDTFSQRLFPTSHSNKNLLFNAVVLLEQTGVSHSRRKYGLLDLLGDLGGVLEVIMLMFTFFLLPVSEHSFLQKAGKKLFFARTSSKGMLRKKREKLTKKFIRSGIFDEEEVTELKKHKSISLSTSRNVSLYFSRVFKSCLSNSWYECLGKRQKKLIHLFEETNERIEEDLDIVKILKNLRNMKILINNQMINRKMKFQIDHSHKNVINLEDSGISINSSVASNQETDPIEEEELEIYFAQEKIRDRNKKWNSKKGTKKSQGPAIGYQDVVKERVRRKLAIEMYKYLIQVENKIQDRRNQFLHADRDKIGGIKSNSSELEQDYYSDEERSFVSGSSDEEPSTKQPPQRQSPPKNKQSNIGNRTKSEVPRSKNLKEENSFSDSFGPGGLVSERITPRDQRKLPTSSKKTSGKKSSPGKKKVPVKPAGLPIYLSESSMQNVHAAAEPSQYREQPQTHLDLHDQRPSQSQLRSSKPSANRNYRNQFEDTSNQGAAESDHPHLKVGHISRKSSVRAQTPNHQSSSKVMDGDGRGRSNRKDSARRRY